MFSQFGNMFKNMGEIGKLAKDENVRKLIMHPKMQELMGDKEFQEIIASKDFTKLLSQPKFTTFIQDSEVKELLSQIDPSAARWFFLLWFFIKIILLCPWKRSIYMLYFFMYTIDALDKIIDHNNLWT